MDMMLIPLFAEVIYPSFRRWGYPFKPTARMLCGLFFAILAEIAGWVEFVCLLLTWAYFTVADDGCVALQAVC